MITNPLIKTLAPGKISLELMRLPASVKNTIAFFTLGFALLFSLFIFSMCRPDKKVAAITPPPSIYFSKNWKSNAELLVGSRFACSYDSKEGLKIFITDSSGISQLSSNDSCRSWKKTKTIFRIPGISYPLIINNKFFGVVTVHKYKYGGQIYYSSFNTDSFSEPSPIRDSNWGDFQIPSFTSDSLNNLYCVWTDSRNGNPDIYFSASYDRGRTWNENIKINDDNGGQEQNAHNIIYTHDGRLCLVWNDNRNPRTLFDLYCSSSTDHGKTWSANIKINDDSSRSWQVISSAVKDNFGTIYLVWTDYRNVSKSGDYLSSIYFSKSKDNGQTWSRNIPINTPINGSDSYPVLILSAEGNLNCFWQNTDDNLLNDILFSYSTDGGMNWSASSRVNDDVERARHHIAFVFQNEKKNFIVGCFDWRESKPEIYISESGIIKDPSRKERELKKIVTVANNKQKYYFPKGNILFEDNFEENKPRGWENRSGTWIVYENSYVGYGSNEAQSFIGNSNWNDYSYEGQFKLDIIDHRAAYIYFRALSDNNLLKYYRIKNFFRTGIKVEYFDGSVLVPVAESTYYIRNNRWYNFLVEIKKNQLNYFLNDSLVITSDRITKITNGKIGVGTFASPSYYKNIKVTEIK